ncbi:HD domain-containing protein [Treponema sp. OMZ 788]|uniref:HD domain-containing protein n=1 Tax=Treponema sp. OMZ 788 TaxID=2563664 RepID=UPI0020A2B861|nr:HD domain-containing protein [Treponema sp. OMZ 788]UTC65454.1 HD domain-containing protein [Treponema sp. OMZ 788]
MSVSRLEKQMGFIFELEKLKTVYRQNGIIGGLRQENSAEHSWHIAVMALLLAEYCKEKIDLLHTLKMLLIHDIVEVYAGDTFLYDTQKREEAKTDEKIAADKIFSLLPDDQKEDFMNTWLEFEERKTPEAQYAAVLDNLQPLLNHYYTNNRNIIKKNLKKSQIIDKKEFIKDFSEELWAFALDIIEKGTALGLYQNL